MVSVNLAPDRAATRARSRTRTARDFEFDETNLFEPNRFPGLDRIETGAQRRLRHCASARSGRAPPRSAASSARATHSRTPRPSRKVAACDDISPTMSARSTSGPARSSISATASASARRPRVPPQRRSGQRRPLPGCVNLGYINLSRSRRLRRRRRSRPVGFESREEITFGVRVQLTEQIAIGGQTRRDLSANADHGQPARPDLYAPLPDLAGRLRAALHARRASWATRRRSCSGSRFKNLGDFETGGSLLGSEEGALALRRPAPSRHPGSVFWPAPCLARAPWPRSAASSASPPSSTTT